MKFNELYVNPEGSMLVIEVSVDDGDSNYPRQIIIDNQDTYIEGNPSSSPIYQAINYAESKVFRLEIPKESINISDNLLFVYCRSSNNKRIMCPVCNFYRLYQSFMPSIKVIGSSCCCLPKGFIDCILRFKALELSIKVGNYLQSIQFWNKFFKEEKLKNLSNNGCCK